MIKKSKILLAEKYDISDRILKELANLESRHILFSIMKHPKSIQDIANEQKIPLSSVYKRIESLKKCALIHVKRDFSENGHITKFYQSKIKDIEIIIAKFEPKITFTKNETMEND